MVDEIVLTSRYLRMVRISWSVAWGVVAVVLCVFWVRSYWWRDMAFARNPDVGSTYAASLQGKLRIGFYREHRNSPADFSRWGVNVAPAAEMALSLERSPMPKRRRALGFELVNYWNPFAFAIPFWFLVLFLGATAAAPWIRWSNRFSLRTLLIAITLVAVLLGLAVWAIRP